MATGTASSTAASTAASTAEFGLRVGQRVRLAFAPSGGVRHPRIGATGTVAGFHTAPDAPAILMDWDLGDDYALVPDRDGWQKI